MRASEQALINRIDDLQEILEQREATYAEASRQKASAKADLDRINWEIADCQVALKTLKGAAA